jgi:hypothetical protein
MKMPPGSRRILLRERGMTHTPRKPSKKLKYLLTPAELNRAAELCAVMVDEYGMCEPCAMRAAGMSAHSAIYRRTVKFKPCCEQCNDGLEKLMSDTLSNREGV